MVDEGPCIDRRTVLTTSVAAVGGALIPGLATADQTTDEMFVPGFEANEAPADNVSKVSAVGRPLFEVPAGNFVDHTIFFIGGTRDAAEWWRDETELTFTIEGETTQNLADSEYSTVTQEDITLVNGVSIEDAWGLRVSYVTNPQSPGLYDIRGDFRTFSQSPDRGEVLDPVPEITLKPRSQYRVKTGRGPSKGPE